MVPVPLKFYFVLEPLSALIAQLRVLLFEPILPLLVLNWMFALHLCVQSFSVCIASVTDTAGERRIVFSMNHVNMFIQITFRCKTVLTLVTGEPHPLVNTGDMALKDVFLFKPLPAVGTRKVLLLHVNRLDVFV